VGDAPSVQHIVSKQKLSGQMMEKTKANSKKAGKALARVGPD